MKKLITILLTLGLLSPAVSLGVAAAQNSSNSTTTTENKTTVSTTTETKNETEAEKPEGTLADRLSKRKTEFKVTLTKSAQTALKSKCKASQGLLSSLEGRIKGIQTSRNEVYKNVTDHLAALQTKLQQRDVDTAELEAELATLRTMINTYKTDLIAYKQAVADLAAMDCASDPVAFKSSLEAARAAREKVAKDMADIRAYVKDTIKPTLAKIRASLEAKEQKAEQ